MHTQRMHAKSGIISLTTMNIILEMTLKSNNLHKCYTPHESSDPFALQETKETTYSAATVYTHKSRASFGTSGH